MSSSLFADADEADRQAEFAGDGDDDAALGGAVELGEDDAGDAGGLGEQTRLLQAVLAGGGVDDKQGLVRGAGDEARGGAAHLVELFHEVSFGVEAAGGVDEEDVGGAGLGGGAGVVERGGGIATLLGLDQSTSERSAQTSSCSMAAARKVSAAQRRTVRPLGVNIAASLPVVVVLPVPLTPTSRMTSGGAAGWVTGVSTSSRMRRSSALRSCLSSSPA